MKKTLRGKCIVKRKRPTPRTFDGHKMVDAAQPFDLKVEQRDCSRGADNDPQHCAAACALVRQFPHAEKAYVGRSVTVVVARGIALRFRTPSPLRDQELRYDASRKFDHSMEFTLLPPPKSWAKRGRRQGSDAPGARDRGSRDRTPKFKRREVGRPDIRRG